MTPEALQQLIEEHGGWPMDSIGWPSFVLDLEEQLGRRIDTDELTGAETPEELMAWVKQSCS